MFITWSNFFNILWKILYAFSFTTNFLNAYLCSKKFELSPKSICSAFVVKIYVLMKAICPPDVDIKSGGPRCFSISEGKWGLMPVLRFHSSSPHIYHTYITPWYKCYTHSSLISSPTYRYVMWYNCSYANVEDRK